MYTYETSARKVEKVATYSYWKTYEKKRKARKRAKHLRKFSGGLFLILGISIPFLWNHGILASLITVLSWICTACVVLALILGLIATGMLLIWR